jgi:hypothetical protein
MIPTLFGLIVLLAGLIMLHYGLSGAVFPIQKVQPISKLGSITSTQ